MKIHAFKVEPRGDANMVEILEDVASLSLPDRLKNVSGIPMRLEHCVPAGKFWSLDFTWIRRDGPGRASPDDPVSDFDLDENEGYGAETAGLFHPESGFMLLQYNHYGLRVRRIQDYLYRHSVGMAGLDINEERHAASHGFEFYPLLRVDAADQVNGAGLIRKISATFHVPGVMARPATRRQSLNSLLDMPLMGGAETLHFEISAGRKKTSSLSLSRVRKAIADLLGAQEEVSQLTVLVKSSEDASPEPIDLLKARMEADVTVQLAGRRYPRNARLAALRRTFEGWRDERIV